MKYFVFEAGGRAGLSAEMFFTHRVRKGSGDTLVMADMDTTYTSLPAPQGVLRCTEAEALQMIASDPAGCTVFPADELARQGKPAVFELSKGNTLVAVEPWFFDKHGMNMRLQEATQGCSIRIPRTFDLQDVFMRPNTMSAGSHGVGRLANTCISEYIPIDREYVVDVNWVGAEPAIYAREVKIKNGYDRFLRFMGADSPIHKAVDEFIRAIRKAYPLMVTGIFHVQIMQDASGQFYFVEYTKRISGTSCVNLFRGYNPFDAFDGECTPRHLDGAIREGEWYRYEDLLMNFKELEK